MKQSSPVSLLILNRGDLVRLLQPFSPNHTHSQEFYFGIIVGVVNTHVQGDPTKQNLSWQRSTNHNTTGLSPAAQVLLHLYDQQKSVTYVDEFGMEALFCFDFDEVELFERGHLQIA